MIEKNWSVSVVVPTLNDVKKLFNFKNQTTLDIVFFTWYVGAPVVPWIVVVAVVAWINNVVPVVVVRIESPSRLSVGPPIGGCTYGH